MSVSRKERLLLLVIPHCEAGMPTLGPFQLAGYAGRVGLDCLAVDLNAAFRSQFRSGQGMGALGDELSQILLQRMPSALTPQDYWRAIDGYRIGLSAARRLLPEFVLHWDGGESEAEWSSFAVQQRFLDRRRHETAWCSVYAGLWDTMDRFRPTVVGLSITFGSQLLEALAVADAIRQRHPELGIVVGGGVVNDCLPELADLQGPLASLVDVVYVGAGEPLVRALAHLGLEGTKSLARRGADRASHLRADELRNYAFAGDELPSPPSFTADALALYASPALVLPYRLSGTCYWGKCRFCADRHYGGFGWKASQTQHHLDGLQQLATVHRPAGFFFLDSAMSPACMSHIAAGLVERNLPLCWGTNARFEEALLQEGFLESLFRGGCRFLRFGLESGSQRVLNLMRKGTTVSCATRVLSRCRSVGILTHAYAMVGFPGEGQSDRQMTADVLLAERSHPDSFSISEFILYGRSPMGKGENRHPRSVRGWTDCAPRNTSPDTHEFIENAGRTFADTYGPSRTLVSPAHTLALYDITASWAGSLPRPEPGQERHS